MGGMLNKLIQKRLQWFKLSNKEKKMRFELIILL